MPPKKRGKKGPAKKSTRQRKLSLEERIKNAYSTPGHPIAFSAPATVGEHFNISTEKAKNILQEIDSYTLHREYKQPRVYNPFYVHGRREQVQADLIEVGKISKENDGVRYLLLLIDIFTKKIWIYPLKAKGGEQVVSALKLWLSGRDTKAKVFLTDRGKEFCDRRVQTLLRDNGIEWQPGKGMMKAAIAERANKTIQILIYKYLSSAETVRYIDQLSDLVKTYNNRPHRTLKGMTPNEADKPQNEGKIQAIFHERYKHLASMRKRPKYSVDTIVRVKTDSSRISSSRRAYAEQFHGEFYRIVRINRTQAVPMYYLRAMDDGENIEGAFYAEEIQPVRGDLWKIEKTLDERVRRGIPEVLVKWKYLSDKWNEWIPKSNIESVF